MKGNLMVLSLDTMQTGQRLWFELERSSGRLVWYAHEGDRHPVGQLDARGAALSLARDHFVLYANGQEHSLVADDHESMMQWAHALQALQYKNDSQPEFICRTQSNSELQPRNLAQCRGCEGTHDMAASCTAEVGRNEDEQVQLLRQMNSRSFSITDSVVDCSFRRRQLEAELGVVQQQNRFLNAEVRRLALRLHRERSVRQLDSKVDALKQDYVFLLQSSLCAPEGSAYFYTGNRHQERVVKLLEEARQINPSLPDYEKLCCGTWHVDSLGFRVCCTGGEEALKYACRQLHQHYAALAHPHLQRWRRHLRRNPALEPSKELKGLVRSGVPMHLRARVWAVLARARVQDMVDAKGPHYYNALCSHMPDDQRVTHHKRQIALDLLRTMPDNIRFADANADGVRKLQEVLQAFCVHNPTIGYCQGMNFLVAMCLLFLEPEDAFWCLVGLTERAFPAHYFDGGLIGARADQQVLRELVAERLPELSDHFTRHDIELATVTLNWFLAVFYDCVPFETLVRIWDCFLLEGPKVLFRFSLALLWMHTRPLLAARDTLAIMRQLKNGAKHCYDVEHLFQISFEVLKPFPRRQDIATKQACYCKTLQEQARKMDIEKLSRNDLLFADTKFLKVLQFAIECAAVYDMDQVWLCYGHQNGAQISKVNCKQNIMYRLNIELESSVMCMHALKNGAMVLGTLSHWVHSYSTKSRRLLWENRLNDSVLCLASHEEENACHVYAGLADGTLAVIKPGIADVYYIPLGSSPVSCVRLVEGKLWCGVANRVLILHARTLDAIDEFHVSSSSLDYLSSIAVSDGVWLTLRSSSVLQLWDPQSLTCRLLFDVENRTYPRSPKGEEGSSITALLPLDGTLVVGTVEGSLVIYHLVPKLSRNSSAQQLLLEKEARTDSPLFEDDETVSESSEEKSEATTLQLDSPINTPSQDTEPVERKCLPKAIDELRELIDKYSLRSSSSLSEQGHSCDSYDYDDVFVAYAEEEESWTEWPPTDDDVPYAYELQVQEKIKVSDQPIKCLLEIRCGSETSLISCAGHYGEDEAVLKWTKVGDEELWTNDPVVEVCPYTDAVKPSPYTRSRHSTTCLLRSK